MTAHAFSVRELSALSLVPGIDYYNPNRYPYFFDANHEMFLGSVAPVDVIAVLAQRKRNGEDVSEVPVYKLCREAEKSGLEHCYFQINNFNLSSKSKSATWESNITVNKNANRRVSKQTMLEINKPFVRMHMMGDPQALVHCPFDGTLIDSTSLWGVPMNNWQGHHMVVVNGFSIHKDVTDPGELLSRLDFTKPSSKTTAALGELSKVVFLGPSAHERIHKATHRMPGKSSDITNYELHQRPWSARSECNWDEWRNFLLGHGYPVFPSYEEHMQALTLPHA